MAKKKKRPESGDSNQKKKKTPAFVRKAPRKKSPRKKKTATKELAAAKSKPSVVRPGPKKPSKKPAKKKPAPGKPAKASTVKKKPAKKSRTSPARAPKREKSTAAPPRILIKAGQKSVALQGTGTQKSGPLAGFTAKVERDLLKSRPAFFSGSFRRVTANELQQFPYRSICSLRIRFPSGKREIGTGFFAGPRLVVTAGHCVYNRSEGGAATQIEVIPGRNGLTYPPGQSRLCVSYRCHAEWVSHGTYQYDYGAVLITDGSPLGTELKSFTIENVADADLLSQTFTVSGYPQSGGVVPAGTQWWHSNRLARVDDGRIYYRIDAMVGQSGAPVFMIRGSDVVAVGVHNYSDNPANFGSRINAEFVRLVQEWNQEVGG